MVRNPRRQLKRKSFNDILREMSQKNEQLQREVTAQKEMNEAIIKDITMFIDILRYAFCDTLLRKIYQSVVF